MPDGTVLPVRVWMPPGDQAPHIVVLALHGFNDSRDAWALPAPVFAAAGIAVFAPDQRGFGDTAARATWPGVAGAGGRCRFRWHANCASVTRPRGCSSWARAWVAPLPWIWRPRADGPPIDGTVMLAPAVWGRSEQGVVLSSSLWLANGVAPGYRDHRRGTCRCM